MRLSGSILAICLFLLMSTVGIACAEEITIGAGAAPVENVLKPIKAAFEKASGLKLTIQDNGPKIALLDLDKGSVDAAAAGLSFDDWMTLMKDNDLEVKDPSVYRQFQVGKDKIVVLINKNNPVSKLSKEQLKGIFTGKIQNWKDVGGNDMSIVVVWGHMIPGTNSMFVKNMLDGEPKTNDTLYATNADDIRHAVSENKGAIGIGPISIVDGTVKSPETPEVARPIIIVTKGNPSPNVQKLIDFIKTEGQKYIK